MLRMDNSHVADFIDFSLLFDSNLDCSFPLGSVLHN